ncbi:alpha/beta fold hydrolase [Bradyrhizobium sp. ARR65]|uniref:alpha/beta fold hydrolase n=1 Tax=Bradyrhizobium sp. ARR65 TaxID=1040989 RepID=UPI000463D666|nr:alpha/beta fold hydrolase [Bradyrhizobium sp. ARR65]
MKRRNLLKVLGWSATAAIVGAPAGAEEAAKPSVIVPPPPWPEPQLAVADRLGYCRIGKGPAVCVVLHEWLGDHVNWEPALPYFDLARHTLVFMDLRGYGWSRAMSGSYTLDEAAADVLRAADKLALSRFHLIGHSMSGLVAQKIALQAAGRVQSATLFSPVPPTGFHADEAAMKALNAVIDEDAAAARAITARTSNRYGAGWLTRKLKIAREAATVEAMRGYLKMFTTESITDDTRRLAAPLHVVNGAQDIPFYRGEASHNAFAAAYPQVSFEMIDDAGHYSMLETPVRVASIIEKHVAAAG